ncbi:hypothetical protein ABWH96_18685 [Marivirga tractuosa]|uniref:hypothetical protein n=1 Tax=Marivirga tractuosa TaxID=1006 RepID=UPI0035D12F11
MIFLFFLLQIPQGVPHPDDSEPLLLQTPFDYIFYVVLPVLFLIGGYFWWRRKKKEKKKARMIN